MDTRIPHFQGQKDFLGFVRFIDNREEFEGYIKLLDAKIAAFVEVTKTYGKANDIDMLHLKAEAVLADAHARYEAREISVIASENKLKQKMAELKEAGAAIEAGERRNKNEINTAHQATATRQAELTKQDVALSARTQRLDDALKTAAAEKQASAVERKKYEDLTARLRAATGPQEAHPTG